MILAIDPGPMGSAILLWDGVSVKDKHFLPNFAVLNYLNDVSPELKPRLAIEMIASYGMPVGKETFDTCVWMGRFVQAWIEHTSLPADFIFRSNVKMHLCQSMRAKDSNIRQALIDRFGPPGTKKNQGVLYGVKSHLWAALAISVTAHDQVTTKGAIGTLILISQSE